jgi:hypothetical protein
METRKWRADSTALRSHVGLAAGLRRWAAIIKSDIVVVTTNDSRGVVRHARIAR